jgi:hypothetical protein
MNYKLLILLIFIPVLTFSQAINKNSLSFQQDFHDYGINVLDGKLINFDSTLSQTFRIGYNRMVLNSVLISSGVSNGFLWNDRLETTRLSKNYAVGVDFTAIFMSNNGKIFRKDAPFSPYFSFGYQYYYINNFKKLGYKPNDVSLQYGAGFNINFRKKSSFQIQSILNQQLGGSFNTHFIHRIGFTQVIDLNGDDPTKVNSPETNEKDYDGDGVADSNDQCPTLAGTLSSFGCPIDYIEEQAKSLAKLDSMEDLFLKLKTKMENINAEIDVLNKLKEENEKSSKIVESIKPKEIIKPDTVIIPKTEEIEIVRDKTYSYYVVTISVLNQHLAVAEAKKIKSKYPNVKVIAQPNGFFRTAIYSGIEKQEALKLLAKVTANGTKQAWIVFY